MITEKIGLNLISIYFLKILKRLSVFQYFNFYFKKQINGTQFKIPVIDTIGFENLRHKTNWLDLLIKEFVAADKTFIDVGANIGQTLLRLKSNSPDTAYIGFEPNVASVYYCQRLIEKNRFRDAKIFNVALSSKLSIGELAKSSNSSPAASISNIRPPEFYGHIEYILTIEFHNLFLNKTIGFVKIDVEGAELDVLKGMENAISYNRPFITCEVLDSWGTEYINLLQQRAITLTSLLRDWDYNIIRLYTKESGIGSYETIDSIKIGQWTSESAYSNDYLFYPIETEQYVIDGLRKIAK